MPRQAWGKKRERQYEHVKESQRERGASQGRAREIAARTVNKDRAQSGQARQQSKTSTRDVAPEHRGGKRSGKRLGPKGRTKQQLYEDAKRQNIQGRSKMNKDELEKAVSRS